MKMITNQREYNSDLLLFLFITIYGCLLQSARIFDPDVYQPSDWNEGYLNQFLDVGNSSFYNYFINSVKEPLWSLINYLGYYLTGGNFFPFINSIAIFTIFLTCYSIYKFWEHTETDPLTLIASLVLIAFFTEYYGMLNNLIRQFFAFSIISYVYTVKLTENKTKWALLFSAGLIHTLAFVFVIFFFINPLYKKLTINNLLKILIVSAIGFIVINNISVFKSFFSNINFLNYALTRIETASDTADNIFFGAGAIYFTAGYSIIIALIMILNNQEDLFNYYVNLLLFLMVIIIGIFYLSPMITRRLYIARMYIFPFVLPYFLMEKEKIHKFYTLGIIAFFFVRFFLTFDMIRGGGFFPPVNNLLTFSFFDFFI